MGIPFNIILFAIKLNLTTGKVYLVKTQSKVANESDESGNDYNDYKIGSDYQGCMPGYPCPEGK